jgi:hypothetical protein
VREAEARQHIESGVEQLFDAAGRLSDAELTMIRAIWESADSVKRDVAWAKAKAHIRRTKRGQFLTNATEQLAEWTNVAGPYTPAGPWGHSLGRGGDPNIRRQTLAPFLDAAAAVIAADGLADEDRAVLMGPLRTVAARHGGLRV